MRCWIPSAHWISCARQQPLADLLFPTNSLMKTLVSGYYWFLCILLPRIDKCQIKLMHIIPVSTSCISFGRLKGVYFIDVNLYHGREKRRLATFHFRSLKETDFDCNPIYSPGGFIFGRARQTNKQKCTHWNVEHTGFRGLYLAESISLSTVAKKAKVIT